MIISFKNGRGLRTEERLPVTHWPSRIFIAPLLTEGLGVYFVSNSSASLLKIEGRLHVRVIMFSIDIYHCFSRCWKVVSSSAVYR